MTAFSGFGGMTEAEFKQFFANIFAPDGGLATSGVLSGLAVAQTATASGSVQISAGAGVVQDALVSGVTPVVNNSVETLDVFTGSPMTGVSNPRNDIVVFNPLTESFQVLVGTPNAAPTDPTVPATSLRLARLRHAANATTIPTAKIDDLRVFTTLTGAAGPWRSFTATLYSGMLTTPTAIGTTITSARYRYLGTGTVQATVWVSRTAGVTITDGLGVSLPVTAAVRSLNCGTLVVAGPTAPTDQSGIAYMSADRTKLIPVRFSNGYVDVDPTLDIRYSVTYEV